MQNILLFVQKLFMNTENEGEIKCYISSQIAIATFLWDKAKLSERSFFQYKRSILSTSNVTVEKERKEQLPFLDDSLIRNSERTLGLDLSKESQMITNIRINDLFTLSASSTRKVL